jgi:hypothetical protein
LVPFTSFFRYMSINVYWQAQPRSRWDPDMRKAETLIVLPNTASIDKYRQRAIELSNQAESRLETLIGKEADYARYKGPMKDVYSRNLRNALVSGELYKVGQALEDLLTNPGVDKDATKPSMADLWKHPDMKELAGEIREFRESVLYGDPLLVSRSQGKGRTVAFLTTAGTALRRGVGEDSVQWNNWGAGEQAIQPFYPYFLVDLFKYLVSEGQAPNRVLGEDVNLSIDATRYAPEYTYSYSRQPDIGAGEEPEKIKPELEKGQLVKTGNVFDFNLKDIRKPGVHRINLTLLGDGAPEDRQEVRAFAFNVDAEAESDLKRASRDRLEPELPPGDAKRGKLTFRNAGDPFEELKERQPDASESSLLYLFFILILIVEQAMAVHLSFHRRSNEQPTGSPQPAATPATQAA